jgi:hypothetical protein
MLTSMAFVAALSLVPGQQPAAQPPASPGAGSLTLTNPRITYGSQFGPVRTDNRFLPGDLFFIAFDIEGLKTGEDGKVVYSVVMQVVDRAGKPVYQQTPMDLTTFLHLGGNKLPAMAFVVLGDMQEPGAYTCKVTVTDKQANVSQVLERPFELLPKSFGLVGVYASIDPRGELPVPPSGIVGQTLWLHFAVVGFQRSAMKQPNVQVTITITDESGRPTVARPAVLDITQAEEKAFGVPLWLPLPLNRPGKFTVKFAATDRLANKSSEYTVGVVVSEPPRQ